MISATLTREHPLEHRMLLHMAGNPRHRHVHTPQMARDLRLCHQTCVGRMICHSAPTRAVKLGGQPPRAERRDRLPAALSTVLSPMGSVEIQETTTLHFRGGCCLVVGIVLWCLC